MSSRYHAFHIHILERAADVYPIVARGSGDATFHGTIRGALVEHLEADRWLERSLQDAAYPRELGGRLFRALFSGEVLVGFRSSLRAAEVQGMGLRLVLTLDPPELARLPWELLYSARFEGFLARRAATPIVRHLSTPNRVRPPIRGAALRVLVAVAEPKDLPSLGQSRQEAGTIVKELAGGNDQVPGRVKQSSSRGRIARTLRRAGATLRALIIGRERVRVDVVKQVTHRDVVKQVTHSGLKDTLREAERRGQGYHLFHFVGHGTSDTEGGQLIFEDENGYADPVPAEQVAELLDATSVNMVFLNACASAQEGEQRRPFYPFRGVAQACVNLGMRAALAMQVEIVDSAAAEFASQFYASLADGEEVEKAIVDARQLVGKAEAADWAVPVLYSRVLEGPILDVRRRSRWKALLLAGAALLGLAIVAALVFGLFFYVAPMPADSFNVAVARFASLDAEGRLQETEESREVSEWLWEAIQNEIDQLPPTLRRARVRGPDKVGIVPGENDEARAVSAAKIAKEHNATILIYGVITTDDGGSRVEPAFYVRDDSFGYGSEMATSDRLGQPVPFVSPLDYPGQYELNRRLFARKQALEYIVSGLAYLFVDEYDDAWVEFQDAADIQDWQDDEGKEVVYLLMGAAKLRQYSREPDSHQRIQALADAGDAFAEAYRLNSDYARSYLGMGAVTLQQAILNPEQGMDEGKLIEAWTWYTASLSAPDQPATAHVDVRAAYGLGQVHLAGYECRLRNWDGGCPQAGWSGDEARRLFTDVITAYRTTQAPDLLRLAGHAHAYLCRLAGLDGQWETMLSECHTAIEVLDDLPGDRPLGSIARYRAWAAYAKKELGRLDEARGDCRRAVREGEGRVPLGELEQWQADLDCSQ